MPWDLTILHVYVLNLIAYLLPLCPLIPIYSMTWLNYGVLIIHVSGYNSNNHFSYFSRTILNKSLIRYSITKNETNKSIEYSTVDRIQIHQESLYI